MLQPYYLQSIYLIMTFSSSEEIIAVEYALSQQLCRERFSCLRFYINKQSRELFAAK